MRRPRRAPGSSPPRAPRKKRTCQGHGARTGSATSASRRASPSPTRVLRPADPRLYRHDYHQPLIRHHQIGPARTRFRINVRKASTVAGRSRRVTPRPTAPATVIPRYAACLRPARFAALPSNHVPLDQRMPTNSTRRTRRPLPRVPCLASMETLNTRIKITRRPTPAPAVTPTPGGGRNRRSSATSSQTCLVVTNPSTRTPRSRFEPSCRPKECSPVATSPRQCHQRRTDAIRAQFPHHASLEPTTACTSRIRRLSTPRRTMPPARLPRRTRRHSPSNRGGRSSSPPHCSIEPAPQGIHRLRRSASPLASPATSMTRSGFAAYRARPVRRSRCSVAARSAA